jgi:cytochrome c peroxidase
VAQATARTQRAKTVVGAEKAIPLHLQDGEEFKLSLAELVRFGEKLFTANWTDQDGAGRPLSKGTGESLSDRSQSLAGARLFNRLSGPDANSCQGCHIGPYQLAGGGGDFVANAFVMAERFDFVTFARGDTKPTRGAVDEAGRPVTLQTVGNSRLTRGLWGAGYLEMLARQMTGDLRRIRDSVQPGQSKTLVAKGVSFGTLARKRDGSWETRGVKGLPRPSVTAATSTSPPSLLVKPWRQSGSVISLRDITNTSFNTHHGIQSTERFGVGTDPDGDGVVNELTRADVTAVTMWQATLPVPGRVIPNDPLQERSVATGERLFDDMHCTSCHVAALPLDRKGWVYFEPNPYNPPKNLRRGETRALDVDLTNAALPQPRLAPSERDPGVIQVPAYTDFKLHDITDAADPTAAEPLDINERAGSQRFRAGNRKFLTRRLWDVGTQPAHFHHGLFTSLKQAVLAHAGEALPQRVAFQQLAVDEQDAVIAFLRSLQVLPPGTKALVVDEHYQPRAWPPVR